MHFVELTHVRVMDDGCGGEEHHGEHYFGFL
jgi:hypothetical protein